jgi:SAM-dependent methyltransferase
VQQKEIIKEKIRERYGKIALTGNNNNDNSDCCFMPVDWYDNDGNSDISSLQSTKLIGYHCKDLELIPQVSILSVDCGAPIDFANIQARETIVDLGSGAGIDILLLSANRLGKLCKVIGIDITDEMLEKARRNTKDNGHINAEFRKKDIEKRIPIEYNTVDIVISNCVINLTTDKVSTFNEINRILDQMVEAAKYQLAGR